MNEQRHWAKLSNWEDGSARYLVPTMCQECNLEVHIWQEDDGVFAVYTIFPQHYQRFWYRLQFAWKYLRTGYWPNDVCLERQDVENLRTVLELVEMKEAKENG